MLKNAAGCIVQNEPIGLLPDGTINIVKAGDPPFKPEVFDREGRLVSDPDDEGSKPIDLCRRNT
jgi:hypothetical protein